MKRRRTDHPATTIEHENEALRLRIIYLKQRNEHLTSQINNLQGFKALNPLLYANEDDGENLKRANAFLHKKLSTMERTYTTRYNEMAREVGETVEKALKAALARKDATIRNLEERIRSFKDIELLEKKELMIQTLMQETNDIQTENEELKQKIKSLEARIEESETIDAIWDAFDTGEQRSR